MKKNPKKGLVAAREVLAKLNDNPDEKKETSKKKKGIISKMNDNPEKKKR